jgi:hypothetical protein
MQPIWASEAQTLQVGHRDEEDHGPVSVDHLLRAYRTPTAVLQADGPRLTYNANTQPRYRC